jgi:putative ABC transport system permease protein
VPATLLELRSAARSLARAPTVTVCAVLCLALGIGATAAISSAIDRALLKSLPFRDPDRLVAVFRTTPNSGPQGTWPQSIPNYLDLAERTRRLGALAAVSFGTALVGLPGGASQASQLYVTGNLFPMLGVAPQRGRFLLPDDEREASPLVAVLSDEFWRTQLGADPTIVGRSVLIDGDPTTVVGIAPRDFRIPLGPNVLKADVWMATRWTPARRAQRRSNFLQLVGRLAPGATVQGADAELRALHAGIVNEFPELRGESVRVAPLQAESVQSIRQPLLLLFGAVCAVLLIAATNVAGLLLARGVQRQREQAVRTALGATRWDAMRPALAESLLVTLAGAALGLALAVAGVRTIGTLAAARMPQLEGLGVDLRVIAFALLLALVVAAACGAVPAWRGAAVDPQDALRGARGAGGARSQHRALRALVVVEIALSLVLLIGAGLVLKGFAGLLGNDPGFETAHVLTLRVTVPAASYADRSAVAAFLEPALEQVRTIPRVESAAAITAPPYVNWGNNSNVRYEGRPADDPSRQPIVEFRSVSPEFFAVTGQRLLGGRLLRASDDERPETPAVVVVNQALVDRDFHGVSPVGTRWHTSDTTFATIVGVVTNVRNAGPIAPPAPEMYFTYRQNGFGSSSFPLMLRVRGDDPAAVAGEVRAAVRRVDPAAAVAQVSPMPEVIAQALGRPRFYFSLLGTFAAVAMALAVAGLYGVLSYAVAQRTRELGIRTALGSTSGGLVSLVARNGLALVGGGLALGMLGGAAVTRLMAFMLYGVSPLDPVAWALAALLMVLAGVVASLVPALRATRVDPTIAMRAE